MSQFLLLHGPSQSGTRYAYSISRTLATGMHPHLFPALAELSLVQKGTHLYYFQFISNPLSNNPGILDFIHTSDGRDTVSLANFLMHLIDLHDKVILLPTDQTLGNSSMTIATGYALGKNKLFATFNYLSLNLPEFFQEGIKPVFTDIEKLKAHLS